MVGQKTSEDGRVGEVYKGENTAAAGKNKVGDMEIVVISKNSARDGMRGRGVGNLQKVHPKNSRQVLMPSFGFSDPV